MALWLEFSASAGGAWSRWIAPETVKNGIGTARYPRRVARDAVMAMNLAKRTLTNCYNERPSWLANAHRALDEAVFAAYNWNAQMTDDEILAALLELNQSRP